MNTVELTLKTALQSAIRSAFALELRDEDIIIEAPKIKEHGDYATTVAMRLVKLVKDNPRALAQSVIDHLDFTQAGILSAEIAGPGFINFKMDPAFLTRQLGIILSADRDYGQTHLAQPISINVEYVSANPTGDLHPGHARGAAIGDALTRILKKAGYTVTREYYLNDAGNQIANMAKSLQAR